MFGGLGDVLRRLQPKGRRVFEKGVRVYFRVLLDALARGVRVADDLVFHIGDVHDVIEFKAAVLQPAPQDILEHEGPQVADVHVVVTVGPHVYMRTVLSRAGTKSSTRCVSVL